LDAGTDERVMLVSRDEQSVLVVSYQEIKACVASAFAYVIFRYIFLFFC
jgi:PAB-dependent poly(A)-specific ribonuclease subunit 3